MKKCFFEEWGSYIIYQNWLDKNLYTLTYVMFCLWNTEVNIIHGQGQISNKDRRRTFWYFNFYILTHIYTHTHARTQAWTYTKTFRPFTQMSANTYTERERDRQREREREREIDRDREREILLRTQIFCISPVSTESCFFIGSLCPGGTRDSNTKLSYNP